MGINLDKDTTGGVNVNLQQPCLVQRRVKQSKETLLKFSETQINDK